MEDQKQIVKIEEYCRTVRVASYEVGAQSTLKLSALLHMCQETSENHLAALGIGYQKMKEDGIVFLIITNTVKIHRMPANAEIVTIKTHPRGSDKAQFYRDFQIYAGEELLAGVMQSSVAANPLNHKILRPQEFYAYGIFVDERVAPEARLTRIRAKGLEPLGERVVRYSDLDYNGHINNTIYGDIFEDFIPGGMMGRCLRAVQIDYINESMLGETLELFGGEEDGVVTLQGFNPRGLGFSARALVEDSPAE